MSSCSPARTPSVPLIKQGPTLALSTLAFLLLFKGLAWSISLGSFRGGPTFPALFIGAAGGLLAAHLPGFSETPAVAVLMAATVVSILRLPLSATVITLLLISKAGLATSPLIIVAVVVAYLTIQNAVLSPRSRPGCHAGRLHAARRAALAYHRNRKPRRQSDMTTGHHARGQHLVRCTSPSPGSCPRVARHRRPRRPAGPQMSGPSALRARPCRRVTVKTWPWAWAVQVTVG